jgi:hypothetical protein
MWSRVAVGAAVVTCLAGAGSAGASLSVATNVQRPALRVDARGWAEVSWTAAGTRRYLLIPPTGRVFPGGRLTRRDVSTPTNAVAIPFRKVLRRTPDGRFWALQAWRVRPDGPVELRFSRWRGGPTQVVIEAVEPRFDGYVVIGRATFHGRPIPLWSVTPEGKRIRSYAYIDRATATGWRRIGGVRVRADGTFERFVPGGGTPRFRAVLPGPSISSSVWAPDARSAAAVPP